MIITEFFCFYFRFYLNGVTGLVVSAFGLAGNLTSFLVLTRKSMSHISTYCYLSALSVFDFFFILCSVLLHAEEAVPPSVDKPSWLEPTLPSYYPYFFPYLHPMAFFIQVASIWLTLAFTVDRFGVLMFVGDEWLSPEVWRSNPSLRLCEGFDGHVPFPGLFEWHIMAMPIV